MESSYIETYLKRARMVWDEATSEVPASQLIGPEMIEPWVETLGDTINSIETQNKKLGDPDDFDPALYRYSVPELSDDGYCSRLGVLSGNLYDLSVRLEGETIENSRFLKSLQEIVQH